MRDMQKAFGGIKAVDHVTVDLYPGEVVGVLGHNGAGKSVLMKMLSGALQARRRRDPSTANGHEINNPRDARDYNIETIYQTLALADNLDAASNLFLGRELVTPLGLVDDAKMEAETRKIMGRLTPNFRRFSTPVAGLSGGQRQSVAISRAVYFNAKILIMDEPTAALGVEETRMVAELIDELKKQGIGIFLIDHDIHQVKALCDRASVMKNGQAGGHREGGRGHRGRRLLGMIILGKSFQASPCFYALWCTVSQSVERASRSIVPAAGNKASNAAHENETIGAGGAGVGLLGRWRPTPKNPARLT
jgi:D-xylose transport system ATP-binding protein